GTEIKQVVAAREVLHYPGRGPAGERAQAARLKESAEPIQRERKPLRGEDLWMRETRDAIRSERVRESGDERSGERPRDLADEEKHAESGEHESRDEEEVVVENRILSER